MKKPNLKKVGIGLLAVCAIGSVLPNETEEKTEAPEEKTEIVETVDRAIIEEAPQEQPKAEEKPEENQVPVVAEAPAKANETPAAVPEKQDTQPVAQDTITEKETPVAVEREPEKQSKTVYITKTGKRYHYDGTCNGGTYYESTLSEALGKGLTACEKCVH